jgi:hypothetical protein
MAKVTIETVKETIRVLDEINGTNHYNEIDWDNPSTKLPDFLSDKKDDKKD